MNICTERTIFHKTAAVFREQHPNETENKLQRVRENDVPSDGLVLTHSPYKKSEIKAGLYPQQGTGTTERQGGNSSGIR